MPDLLLGPNGPFVVEKGTPYIVSVKTISLTRAECASVAKAAEELRLMGFVPTSEFLLHLGGTNPSDRRVDAGWALKNGVNVLCIGRRRSWRVGEGHKMERPEDAGEIAVLPWGGGAPLVFQVNESTEQRVWEGGSRMGSYDVRHASLRASDGGQEVVDTADLINARGPWLPDWFRVAWGGFLVMLGPARVDAGRVGRSLDGDATRALRNLVRSEPLRAGVEGSNRLGGPKAVAEFLKTIALIEPTPD